MINESAPVPDPTKLTTDAVNAVTDQYRRDIDSTLRLVETRLDDLRSLLDERYATQTKALDAAFVAAEKAVSTALDSAEKAVSKAEIANEKRFATVDEFRNQLIDQMSNVMTRTEAGVRIDSISEKLDAEVGRTSERLRILELRVNSRLDLAEGNKKGANSIVYGAYLTVTLLVAIIVATVMIISSR